MPSPLANIIGDVKRGDTILITGYADTYWHVFKDNKKGFINELFLSYY
jgi:hypothetical protein